MAERFNKFHQRVNEELTNLVIVTGSARSGYCLRIGIVDRLKVEEEKERQGHSEADQKMTSR